MLISRKLINHYIISTTAFTKNGRLLLFTPSILHPCPVLYFYYMIAD